VATVAFLHAHPDDECLATGGTIARLAAEGHRVVVITATDGELGEMPEGMLAEGETVAEQRIRELEAACRELGVHHGELLGYRDSGMAGTEGNTDERCFARADVEDAAAKVAALLQRHEVDVLVVYDENGNYFHPDHIQVHRVGMRAADVAGTPALYQATIDRDAIKALLAQAAEAGELPEGAPPDDFEFGMPSSMIDTRIDVSSYAGRKRAAMRCHRSQVGDMGFFLTMPEDMFALSFGTEWFIKVRGPETGGAHLVPAP
jgi:LmbE family N-acetylglucosaminyl deacetylase